MNPRAVNMHSNHLCPSLSIQYFYPHTMPSLQRGRWLPGKRLPWQLLGKRNMCVPSRCAKSKMQIQRRRRGNWILEALVGMEPTKVTQHWRFRRDCGKRMGLHKRVRKAVQIYPDAVAPAYFGFYLRQSWP